MQCPKKPKSRCTNIYRGWAVWSGVFPFWDFCLKMAHFGCIFCHTRDFPFVVYFCSSRIFFRKQMVKIPWHFHDSLHFPWLSMTVGTMVKYRLLHWQVHYLQPKKHSQETINWLWFSQMFDHYAKQKEKVKKSFIQSLWLVSSNILSHVSYDNYDLTFYVTFS